MSDMVVHICNPSAGQETGVGVPRPPTSWPSLFWESFRLMRCPVSKDKQATSGHHMLAQKMCTRVLSNKYAHTCTNGSLLPSPSY